MQKSFTLIELLVVIALLALLATGVIIFINPAGNVKKADDAIIKQGIAEISRGLQAYATANLVYPESLDKLTDSGDLKTLPTPPSGGPYPDYQYDRTSPCTKTSCEAAVWYPLEAPKMQNALWCWRSAIATFQETASCSP